MLRCVAHVPLTVKYAVQTIILILFYIYIAFFSLPPYSHSSVQLPVPPQWCLLSKWLLVVLSNAVSALGPEPGSNWVRSRPHLLRVLINPDSIRIQRTHIRMWVEVSSTRIQRWAWYLSHDNRRRHAQT